MAQLAVTVAGAAIGNALLPGIGGILAGAAVGSLLYAGTAQPKTEGPRTQEREIQTASFGTPVPMTWGSDRVTGSVIWEGKRVKSTRKSGGGKGKPKVATDSWSQSFAVAINARVVKALRRIWADTVVIYDAREGAGAEAQAASAEWRKYWVLYPGNETQLPDPTIEAELGAGNVPAYRGTAYVVFTAFPQDRFGNRIPNLKFEIETERDEVSIEPDAGTILEPLRVYPWTVVDGRPDHSFGPSDHTSETYGGAAGAGFVAVAAAQAAGAAADGGFTGVYGINSELSTQSQPGYWHSSVNPAMNIEGGASLGDDPQYVFVRTMAYPPGIGPRFDGETYSRDLPLSTHVYIKNQPSAFVADRLVWRLEHGGSAVPPSGYASTPYTQTPIGGGLLTTAWMSYAYTVRTERVPWHPPKTCRPSSDVKTANPCAAPEKALELPDDGDWCATCGGEVVPNRDWITVSATAKQLAAVEYRGGRLFQNGLGPVLLPGDPNYSNAAFWAAERAAAIAAGTLQGDVESPVVVSSYAQSTGGPTEAWEVPDADTTTLTVGEVVAGICRATERLTDPLIDVSELTDTIIGYTLTRHMSARAGIEPLALAYQFAGVESDGKIAFRKKARSTSATITLADLGAAEGRADQIAVRPERAQEDELPVSVVLTYRSVARDYQQGSQRADRRVGGSQQPATYDVPIVMTDTQAKQLAEVLLYTAHAERVRRTISTTRRFAAIEPGDVIEVNDADL